MKHHPEVISHVTLIDPVSLLLGLPDVAYNFIYRAPTSFIQRVICYGASREITVSNALHRHFCWQMNTLWLEDIPAHIGVVVAVSGKDPILNATSVAEYTHMCQSERQALPTKDFLQNTNANIQQQQQEQQQQQQQQDITADIDLLVWPTFTHAQLLLDSRANYELNETIIKNEAKIALKLRKF